MTGKTGMTGMTWMTRMTDKTRMTGKTRIRIFQRGWFVDILDRKDCFFDQKM